MTRELASSILRRLQVYYPKQYPVNWGDERCTLFVDDLVEVYDKYKEEKVVAAYKRWHEISATAPTTFDILNQLNFDSGNLVKPFKEKEYEYYIGDDGNEYAREIK